NSLIGLEGDQNSFYRNFQDSGSIGLKEGGEQVLRGPNQRILYAAVAIQYFASAIVVDDEQADRDFLAWARPTLVRGELHDVKKPRLDDITVRVVSQPLDVKTGGEIVHKYLLYNGPIKVRLLADGSDGQRAVPQALVDRYNFTLHLNTLTDYHMPTWIS